jgi:hypothetical protein
MSTMYYFYPEMQAIGQVHSLGKDKGYHFTWCMFPLTFCTLVTRKLYKDAVTDEYHNDLSVDAFVALVTKAVSQSFDERIV